MNLEQLRSATHGTQIIFETVAGSHAYGTATPRSDTDIRGLFLHPPSAYLGINSPVEQVGDDKSDVVFYSLHKFFRLLAEANPNIIELLWMPQDCVKIQTPIFELLQRNRQMFITKKCYHSHSGYAFAQIKKAQGQNKMINNPCPKEKPVKEDFCWIILDRSQVCGSMAGLVRDMPGRPIPLKDARWLDMDLIVDPRVQVSKETGWGQAFESPIDLAQCHVAALDHTLNAYRLYRYGKAARGVFRDGQLVCESIPKEDELKRFIGYLIYNDQGYDMALKQWHQYWEWMEKRNPERWEKQEQGLNYDQKNIMHCVRLLISGSNILEHGEPLVRFSGDDLDYLRAIRAGKVPYDVVMADVEVRMKRMEVLYTTSTLPWGVDGAKVDSLYRQINAVAFDTNVGIDLTED